MKSKRFRVKGKASNEKPAADGDQAWYFSHGGETFGPVDDADLCAAADEDRLLPSDEVWRSDLTYRLRALEVADLFPELQSDDADKMGGAGSQQVTAEEPARELIFESWSSASGSITCPHCWFHFETEDLLYVARHPDLIGDPILGADAPQRFVPTSFTPEGHAIDAQNVPCPDIACPRCRMQLPRSTTRMPPLFLSLVGAPASGKSYFLTSMCWRLRRTLPRDFMIRFNDADGKVNRWLNEYEERLFCQPDAEAYQAIDKTELQGALYREIIVGGMSISLPLPSIFTLQAEESSAFHRESGDFIGRSLVLYDNAGEHFEPGRDSASDPGTHHLVHSEAILFVLDPTNEPALRKVLAGGDDPQLGPEGTVHRQDVLLTEIVNRIRMYSGHEVQQRFERPLIVLVSKADVLTPLLGDVLESNPWGWDDVTQAHALDVSKVLQVSFRLRCILETYAPELVATVESVASDVIYVPVSALGHSPSRDPGYSGEGAAPLVVRPADVSPKCVEVPFLYILFRLGYIAATEDVDESAPLPETFDASGNMIHFVVPGTDRKVRLPTVYAGQSLELPDCGVRFRVPSLDP